MEIQIKQNTLLHSSSLIAVMTFVSRMLGFIRDMILAQAFGATAAMDAFFVAFRIPNFMRRLFAEGAFSQAFVPVLADYQKTRSFDDVRQFIAYVAGQLGMILLFVSIGGILLAPLIIRLFAPGFDETGLRFTLATELLRFTFPYLMFISLTGMMGAVLNTYGYFGVPAITPALLNITMIAAVWWICPYLTYPVKGLAIGVLLAGCIQFLFQFPFLYRRHLIVCPRLNLGDVGVQRVIKLMIPALFGVSIAQLNLMVDSVFASFLKIGSVSWLYYTDRLADFPLGVFGVAIATVILPYLSKRHVEAHPAHFSKGLDWGLRVVLLVGIPASVGLIFYATPIIAVCFGYGAFTAYDLVQTQKSLITLSIGIPAFMMVKVLASGFYAQQDIKTPVKIGALSMLINSLLCALLILPLQHAGLTLASALSGYVNAGCLWRILQKRHIYQPQAQWGRYLLKLLIANGCMGCYLWWQLKHIAVWLQYPMLLRAGVLGWHIVIASLIYVMALIIMGMRLNQFKGQIRE